MGVRFRLGLNLHGAVRLGEDERRGQLCLLRFALTVFHKRISLVADPALEHLIFVELHADHGLVATAVKELVRTALHLVELARVHIRLQAVPHVGHVLGFSDLGQVDHDALVINHRPIANLAGPVALRTIEHFDGVVGLKLQVQFAGLPRKREL